MDEFNAMKQLDLIESDLRDDLADAELRLTDAVQELDKFQVYMQALAYSTIPGLSLDEVEGLRNRAGGEVTQLRAERDQLSRRLEAVVAYRKHLQEDSSG